MVVDWKKKQFAASIDQMKGCEALSAELRMSLFWISNLLFHVYWGGSHVTVGILLSEFKAFFASFVAISAVLYPYFKAILLVGILP